MDKHEDFIANMEAARNESCDSYFKARPQLFVTTEKERIFEAGFEAAYKQQAETIGRLQNDRQVLLDACESTAEIINMYLEGDAVIKTNDLEDIQNAFNKLEAGEL